MMKNLCIFLFATFLLAAPFRLYAQTEQEIALANQYLADGELDKALPFFEKFYSNEPFNEAFYQGYLTCLIKAEDFKTAEKVIKKQIKNNPLELCYRVDLVQNYKASGEEKSASKEFDGLVKDALESPSRIEQVGGCLITKNEKDNALILYEKAKKAYPEYTSFNFQLAELYKNKGENQKMIDVLMQVIKTQPAMESSVENALLTLSDDDPESELNQLIKSTLVQEIQKSPDNTTFASLLISIYTSQRNFEGAYVQTKALDKRLKEDGARLIRLGETCLENREYTTAAKCFESVIEKGNASVYYRTARIKLLAVLKYKTLSGYEFNLADVQTLEKRYKETIDYIGLNSESTPIITELAHLQAFYLGKTDSAITLLTSIIDGGRGSATDIGRTKMELADILILTGEMWEPSLLYGQVEKEFKQDILGQEAKFRNSRLSFYRGEFEWAQQQMDVLKASTSKLMANDALSLSLLIMDNMGLDSNTDALAMYSRADLLSYQIQWDAALATLDTLESKFPNHPLQDEVLYKRADILIRNGKTDQAVSFLEKIVSDYHDDLLGDDALFKLADIQELYYKNGEKAQELYLKLMTDYKGSLYVVEARKRFRQLRGDKVN